VGLVIRLLLTGGYIGPAGRVPENRSHARTDEEELVKAYILNNADKDADKVKFLTWGPHMSRQELVDLVKEAGIDELADIFGRNDLKKFEPFRAIIRVRYECFDGRLEPALRTYDHLFIVYAKLVIPLGIFGNEGNDDWKQQFRKKLSKRFPALKP
jgi:hypothetical protein